MPETTATINAHESAVLSHWFEMDSAGLIYTAVVSWIPSVSVPDPPDLISFMVSLHW